MNDISIDEITIKGSNSIDFVCLKYGNKSIETANYQGIIILVPAMAVKQYYYSKLASYLAENGFLTFSFDYNGIGLSKFKSIRNSKISMNDWITNIEDTISFIEENYNKNHSKKLFYFSHSLGGQLMGILRNNNLIDASIMITSQNGYWRYYNNKYLYFLFWYLLVPASNYIFGYFPFQLLRGGENLPKDVMNTWKRWCTSEDYLFDDQTLTKLDNYKKYTKPIKSFSFTDDGWANKEAVDSLLSHYTNAEIDHHHVDPNEYNLNSIGHFGFFKQKCREMWDENIAWLLSII